MEILNDFFLALWKMSRRGSRVKTLPYKVVVCICCCSSGCSGCWSRSLGSRWRRLPPDDWYLIDDCSGARLNCTRPFSSLVHIEQGRRSRHILTLLKADGGQKKACVIYWQWSGRCRRSRQSRRWVEGQTCSRWKLLVWLESLAWIDMKQHSSHMVSRLKME